MTTSAAAPRASAAFCLSITEQPVSSVTATPPLTGAA
jgi:hypothetical protein